MTFLLSALSMTSLDAAERRLKSEQLAQRVGYNTLVAWQKSTGQGRTDTDSCDG